MEVGAIQSDAAPAAVSVTLMKQQAKQEEAVISKLLEGAGLNPAAEPGKGGLINVVA